MKRGISLILIFLNFILNVLSQNIKAKSFDVVTDMNDIHFNKIPYTLIEIIDIKKQIAIDTSATFESQKIITYYLSDKGKILIKNIDTLTSKNENAKYNLIAQDIDEFTKFGDTIYNKYFDSIIENSERPYVAFVLQNGFYCTKQKRINKNITSLVIGIASIGMYIPMPVMACSNVFVFILDKKNKHIIYKDVDVKHYYEKEMPYSKILIENQLENLLFRLQDRVLWNIKNKNRKEKKEK